MHMQEEVKMIQSDSQQKTMTSLAQSKIEKGPERTETFFVFLTFFMIDETFKVSKFLLHLYKWA